MNKNKEIENLVLLREKILLADKLFSAKKRFDKTDNLCEEIKRCLKASAYLNPFKPMGDLLLCIAFPPTFICKEFFKHRKVKLEKKYNNLLIITTNKVKTK